METDSKPHQELTTNFSQVYHLRTRMEAWRHSMKSLVRDLVGGRMIQTIIAEMRTKIVYYNLIWAIRSSHRF